MMGLSDDLLDLLGAGRGGILWRPSPGPGPRRSTPPLPRTDGAVVMGSMFAMAEALFPERPPLVRSRGALGIIEKAFEAGDLALGVVNAVAWAVESGRAGIPPQVVADDEMTAFQEVGWDLAVLAEHRLVALHPNRLSRASGGVLF